MKEKQKKNVLLFDFYDELCHTANVTNHYFPFYWRRVTHFMSS